MPFQQSKLCMNFQRFYWEYSLSPPQDHLFITTPFFLVQNIIQSTMTIPFRKQVEYDHLNQCSPDQDCCSDVLTACAVDIFLVKRDFMSSFDSIKVVINLQGTTHLDSEDRLSKLVSHSPNHLLHPLIMGNNNLLELFFCIYIYCSILQVRLQYFIDSA